MTTPSQDTLDSFLSAEKIDALVKQLARAIERDYSPLLDENSELIVAVTLKGALFFAADLLRELRLPVKIDFIRVASYGAGTESSGNVVMTKDIEAKADGNHILILDEIVDSGYTIQFLLEKFGNTKAKSVKVCTLLNKPSRRKAQLHVDYVGMDVEDKFLVGYGLDYNEKYRNLREIFAVRH